jgi:hypothetical protein
VLAIALQEAMRRLGKGNNLLEWALRQYKHGKSSRASSTKAETRENDAHELDHICSHSDCVKLRQQVHVLQGECARLQRSLVALQGTLLYPTSPTPSQTVEVSCVKLELPSLVFLFRVSRVSSSRLDLFDPFASHAELTCA